MVIACVAQYVREHGHELNVILPQGFRSVEGQANVGVDENEHQRYLQGEYKIILQLISALPHGKISKMLVDRAIDACSHIQDIRGAIYDYKLRLESLEAGSKKFETLFRIGVNYLVRYFYLITFADYLLERNAVSVRTTTPFPLFSAWLAERREISNFIHGNFQDFA